MRLIDAERNWEETASNNTGYKLEYNDGIFALYDPQGAILCEFMPDLPTAYNIDKVVEELDDYLFDKYCIENDNKITEIVNQGVVADDVCIWLYDNSYPYYKVGCKNSALPIKYGDYCPYCSKKIKVVE